MCAENCGKSSRLLKEAVVVLPCGDVSGAFSRKKVDGQKWVKFGQ